MNATEMHPLRRIDSLEVLRKPVCDIVEVLDRQHPGETFPLSPARQQAGRTADDLHRELALGYVEAACDLCAPAGAVPFLQGRSEALALTRAIQYGSP